MSSASRHSGASAPEIGDYAIIGDCRSAALISRAGSIDWLCWPRFESPAQFCALLDSARGGCFAIRPAAEFTTLRRYIDDTNVLETTFNTATGSARLTDLMPVASEAEKRRALRPEHQILRRIECTEGQIEMQLQYAPRPDYARRPPRLRERGKFGIYEEHAGQLLTLTADVPLLLSADSSSAEAQFTLRQGERRYASLVFSDSEPAIIPPLGEEADQKIRTSINWWRDWSSRCRYQGRHRDAVIRSALVLKLMTFAPSGAVVAAPTTSLPEAFGGVRNWDYRYCWLRDASLTLQALHDLGYTVEAEAYLAWLVHATRLTWPKLQPLYDVYGERDVEETQLDHLDGFAASRPVRVGNAAGNQLQLDLYGEVVDAVFQFTRRGGRLDRTTSRMLAGFGETVCRCWREPDEGIWEIRGERQQHTFSKVMCWVALDRLVKLHDAGHVRIARDRLVAVCDEIRCEIERRGFSGRLGSYVAVFDGDELDASLLQLARYGYVDAESERMRGTIQAIRARLGRDGLIYRYLNLSDGLPPGEGAFGICGFWAVDALARSGDLDGANAAFEHLLAYGNDVGLFAEQIDPDTGRALGNFPQAFTHIGLIDAALTLARATDDAGGKLDDVAAPVSRTKANV
jgi:GH15 family glucan-1,4-alpha-glucosidase